MLQPHEKVHAIVAGYTWLGYLEGHQGDQKIRKKILPIFQKVAKKAKISTTKLNLKAQNIYIQTLLKTYNPPTTNHVLKLLIKVKQKVAQNIANSLGYVILMSLQSSPIC